MRRTVFSLRFCLIIFWTFTLVAALVLRAQTVAARDLPPGFYLVAEELGVTLYRKDYAGGSPDFVQLVDLSSGASVDLLHGGTDENNGKRPTGLFYGPNPVFRQKTIGRYWEQYAAAVESAFCVLNGGFFFMLESPTPLALPLKVGGALLAEGFGFPQYPEKQLMLALWPGRADILPLTQENLYGTDAPDVIGGLTPEANKKPRNAVGRTFMGILNTNGDGAYETVAILTTQTATQAQADNTLRSFGAAKVIMLDGGGSTQLVCQGERYIDTTRILPQAIGVAAAPVAGAPASDSSLLVEAQPVIAEPDPPQAAVQPSGESPVDPGSSLASISQPEIAQTDSLTITEEGGISSGDAATPAEAAVPPEAQQMAPDPGAAGNTATPPPEISTASVSAASPEPLQLSMLPQGLPAAGEQKQAGFIPLDAGQRNPGRADQPDSLNLANVLWLPAVISPLSIIILIAARRRSKGFYGE